jgi:hypothetical protein
MEGKAMDRNSSFACRWGGGLLGLGAFTYAVSVVLFVVIYGQPHGTGPWGEATLADRIAHYQERQQVAHTIWSVEVLAAVLIAVAGFVLLNRAPAVHTRIHPRVAWATVGVGSMLLSLMYAFMLGGFPAAAAASNAGLFDVLNRIATFLFQVGNAVVFLGLAGAFASEAAPGGVITRGLALGGVAACLLGVVTALAMLAGMNAMAVAAPIGLIGFLITAYLGSALRRNG